MDGFGRRGLRRVLFAVAGVVLLGASLKLDPPDGHPPRLTAQAAYRSWCSGNAGLCGDPAPRSVTIVLALLTTPNSGPAHPDGTLARPGVDHVLSYVIVLHDVSCHSSSGPASTGPDGRPRPAYPQSARRCDRVDPVSALTGRGIAGEYLD